MEIELRHLRSFLTLAEEMHFGRAAERLRVAQPALSRQIRGLERELGTALFDRASRPIALTSAGLAFLHEARVTVRQAKRAVDIGRRAGRGEIGHLAVGTTFWGYTAIVPALVRAFRVRAPEVGLELSTARGPTVQVEGLERERLDVCITAFGHWSAKRRALQVEPLLEEAMEAIVPEHHRFADRSEIELAELATEPLVVLSHAVVPGLVDRQMAIFHEQGLSPTPVQEAPDPLALFSLIGAGVGLGIHMASFGNLRPSGVTFVPIAGNPTAKLLLLWRCDDHREIVRMFLDTARQVAGRREGPAALRRLAAGGPALTPP
jgi:DNA-binding transcriptional LysR family regulator